MALCTHAGGPISWQSKKQATVALSSTEAEYMAASSATKEALWLRKLMVDLGLSTNQPIQLNCDNQSCIKLAHNPKPHDRSKHIAIRYHFLHEQVDLQTIQLVYCSTTEMLVDFLTKALPRPKYKFCVYHSGLRLSVVLSLRDSK